MTCRKNYWGTCFQQLTTYKYKERRKKYLRSSHVDCKREIACFHVETATGKREKWRENRGHVVIFAVRVSLIRDAISFYYLRQKPLNLVLIKVIKVTQIIKFN